MDLIIDPISIRNEFELENVTMQHVSARRLTDGSTGYLMDTKTIDNMSLNDYRTISEQYQTRYTTFDIDKMENEYWKKLENQSLDWEAYLPRYAIDNRLSLFHPNAQIWNFSKFTGRESEIHEVSIRLNSKKVFYEIHFFTLLNEKRKEIF